MSIPKTRVDDNGRVCTVCHVYKTWAYFEFTGTAKGTNGHHARCRECRYKLHKYNADRERNSVMGAFPGTFEIKLKEQDGKCAICEIELKPNGRSPDSICLDHCHKTFRIRGVLCQLCNRMIGNSKDNPETLRKGADYLERP